MFIDRATCVRASYISRSIRSATWVMMRLSMLCILSTSFGSLLANQLYFFFITEFTTRTLLTSLSVLVNMSTFHT